MADQIIIDAGASVDIGSCTRRIDRSAKVLWLTFITALVALFLFRFPSAILSDPDTYWHIATGHLILSELRLPIADPFSHTANGRPWILFEWLSQVILGGTYWLGGWNAVVVLCLSCAILALLILSSFLLEYLRGIHVAIISVLAAFMLMPHLLARPHILILPIMLLCLTATARAVDERSGPPFWLLPFMTAWANMHGSFVLGLALVALLAIEAVSEAWNRPARGLFIRSWVIFIAAMCTAALITPQGWNNIIHVLGVQAQPVQMAAIKEWHPPKIDKSPLSIWLALFLLTVLVLGVRVKLLRTVGLIALLFLALRHTRHVELIGFLAPVLLASSLSGPLMARKIANPLGSRAALARKVTAIFAFSVAAFVVAKTTRESWAPQPEITPASAVSAVGADRRAGKVLNDYGFGGYLIFRGIPTFIDGRADLFGDEFLKTYMDAMAPGNTKMLKGLLDAHDISWTVLRPKSPAAKELDDLAGWRRLYGDDVAVVHVRDREPSQ